jgi:hypothetical protein
MHAKRSTLIVSDPVQNKSVADHAKVNFFGQAPDDHEVDMQVSGTEWLRLCGGDSRRSVRAEAVGGFLR